MYKGTTPTFIFTLPETVDLSMASNVYVTFAKRNGGVVEKTGDDLVINSNIVNVFLTQKETLSFTNEVSVQINWTYQEGSVVKRACTEIKTINVSKNLISRAIE